MGSAAKGTVPPKWPRVFAANATVIRMIQYCVRLVVLYVT